MIFFFLKLSTTLGKQKERAFLHVSMKKWSAFSYIHKESSTGFSLLISPRYQVAKFVYTSVKEI